MIICENANMLRCSTKANRCCLVVRIFGELHAVRWLWPCPCWCWDHFSNDKTVTSPKCDASTLENMHVWTSIVRKRNDQGSLVRWSFCSSLVAHRCWFLQLTYWNDGRMVLCAVVVIVFVHRAPLDDCPWSMSLGRLTWVGYQVLQKFPWYQY